MNKTVRTAETEPAATDPADSRIRTTDVLGAVVDTVSRYCDALIVSHCVAPLVTALWQAKDPPARAGAAGIALPPIVATDTTAALEEATALALDGLRVAVVDAPGEFDPLDDGVVNQPLVLYRILDNPQSDSGRLRLVATSSQQAVDYSIIAHAAAELSLCQATVSLATELAKFDFDAVLAPHPLELAELLGSPSDQIPAPTDYQKTMFGDHRARIPSGLPESLDGGRLLADAEKILASVTASYEKITGRPVGQKPVSTTKRGAQGIRVAVVSSQSQALARFLAEATSGIGIQTSVRATPTGHTATVEVGADVDHQTDVLVSPGSTRGRLSSEVAAIREGGCVLLQSESTDPEETWMLLPDAVREQVRSKGIRVFASHAEATGSELRFEDTFVQFVFAAANGELPTPETHHGDGKSRSNGEAATTGALSIPFVFEIPWQDFAESPNFYSGSSGLHLADAPPAQASDNVLRQLITFHNTGQSVGRRIDDAGLVPVQLYPYVSSAAVRGPYPVLVPEKSQGRPTSLTALMDGLVLAAGADDDKKRLVARMEAALLDEYSADTEADFAKLCKAAANRVSHAALETEDAAELRGAVKELISDLPDGRLHDFGPATTIRILNWTVDRDWSARFAPVREDAEALAVMMEEFLRADAGGSEESGDPDHLRAAMGKGYEDELDFEALARIVEETRVSDPLPPRHRHRLESTARDLRQLPEKLTAGRRQGVLYGPSGLTQAIARTHENLRTVAALMRSIRIALLESSGRYREEVHDPLFDRFGIEHLTDDERAICPPFIVDLGSSATLSRATRGAMMEVLGSDLPVKLLVAVDDVPTRLRTVAEADPSVAATAGLALQAIGSGTAYVMQAPASEVPAFIDAAESAARYDGPALFSMFYGSTSTLRDPDGYLASAAAVESRAFPVFSFDPAGAGWADRISIGANPATAEPWSRGEIGYSAPDGADATLSAAFTFADFLAINPRAADHFRLVPVADWQPQMIEIDQFIELGETETVDRVPFLWMADERGRLERVVVTYPITDAVRSALRNWRTIQELGGAKSSFADRIVEAERSLLEEERQKIAAEAEERIRSELDRATGALARDIVSNIAAGLLGLRPTGGDIGVPRAVPATTPAPEVEVHTEVEQAADAAVADQQDEEEEAIVLDEPYIETPRCTSCNECTNMNSRMFAYDQNKQAFIKDASAGTFRELVLAAEKCPVRIIHPGKPLNPDESGLDELIKRAQPFQ